MEVAQLKKIPLFADASDEELSKVAAFAESKEYQDGRVLVAEGGYSRAMWAIEEGKVEVTRDGEHVADLGPGDIFGEAGMIDDTKRAATVTAKTPVKLISLGHFELQRLKKSAPKVYKRIEALIEERSKL